MKKTEEKVAQPDREKAIRPTPNSGRPQQPRREKKQEIRQPPEFSTHKKVRPEEWQPGIPTEYQGPLRGDEEDIDDIEENETTV